MNIPIIAIATTITSIINNNHINPTATTHLRILHLPLLLLLHHRLLPIPIPIINLSPKKKKKRLGTRRRISNVEHLLLLTIVDIIIPFIKN
jgi:hypothetical protein